MDLTIPKMKKESNRRKLQFREEALEAASKLVLETVSTQEAWILYKLDCLECKLHDVANPKSANCRDNPYCINRLGLEKFQKLLRDHEQQNDKVIKEQVRRNPSIKPCGLVNTGNFCYVNSFLQVWFNEPGFRQIVFDWRPSDKYEKPLPPAMDVQNVMNSLQQLFFTLQTTPFEDTDDNKLFTESLRLGNEQQDAQEFSIMLFGALDRNLPKHPNGANIANAIKERYSGQTRERLWCECGGKNSTTGDTPFISLQLNIDGFKSLTDALAAHFSAEKLDDYRCDACGEKGSVQRQTSTTYLPSVLMLQLNRYVYDTSGVGRKLKTPLAYPRELSSTALYRATDVKETFQYELFAVMIHEGENTFCGHYYDLVKNLENDKWYKYNDSTVEELPKAPGCEKGKFPNQNSRYPPDSKACYGLVYRRRGDPADLQFTVPPAAISDQWRAMNEKRFSKDTTDEIMTSQLRYKEVLDRNASLSTLFESLKTHADKYKKPRNLAFLPTSLITDVLAKEFERAASIADSFKSPTPRTSSLCSDGEVSNASDVESDVTLLKSAVRRTRVNHVPREHIAQLLSSHEMLECCHGGVPIDSVLFGDVKAVSRQAAETLLTRYAISIVRRKASGAIETNRKLLTGDDVCVECVKQLVRESHFKSELEGDIRLASNILKDKKRCSMVDVRRPDRYLYVSKKCLQNYKKLALSEMEHQHRLQNTNAVLEFNANNTNGHAVMNIIAEPVVGDGVPAILSPNKRGRPRKRLLEENLNFVAELPNKCAKDVQEEIFELAPDVHASLSKIDVDSNGSIQECLNSVVSTTERNGVNGHTHDDISSNECAGGNESDGAEHNKPLLAKSNSPDCERPSSAASASYSEAVDFNDMLRCPHGLVNIPEHRFAVSPEEWQALSGCFNSRFEVFCSDDICRICVEDEKDAMDGIEVLKDNVKDLMRQFGDFFKSTERREIRGGQLGTKYNRGICSVFLTKMRAIFRRHREVQSIPEICQNCVLCQHSRPYKHIQGEQETDDNKEAAITPLTEAEWTDLVKKWSDIHPDAFPQPIPIQPEGVPEDMCDSCFGENVESITLRRFQYDSGTIYVKMVLQSEVDDPSPPTNVKQTRRTQQKGCIKVKMCCEDTIKDLKVKLYKDTQQSPNDQLLYTCVGGKLLEDQLTLFEARIEPNNSDNPLILITQSVSSSPVKYNEQRAPERGFVDTALAH